MKTQTMIIITACLATLSVTMLPANDAARAVSDSDVSDVQDDPKLPRVLLIGDSISLGYADATREALHSVANIHHIGVNGGPTTNGLSHLDHWLGGRQWDVIHFNWGLHDLKYVNDKGRRVAPMHGTPKVGLQEYETNLRKLVARLNTTDAKLIWATITPIPDDARYRNAGDEKRYNAVASRIMTDEHIAINDLHAASLPYLDCIQKPADVHFRDCGSAFLGVQVARSIRAAIEGSP